MMSHTKEEVMGTYLYSISTKAKKVGRDSVHPSKFAYKPSMYGRREDEIAMQRVLGPTFRAWRNMPFRKIYYTLGPVVPGAQVFEAEIGHGVTSDDSFPAVAKIVGGGRKMRLQFFDAGRQIDQLVKERTAFLSLQDMLDAGGPAKQYVPSIDWRDPEMVQIAGAYDAAQQARGDERRTYRYG
jgi:hypothetical protein